MGRVCTKFVNTDELELVNPPSVGFYLKHFDYIRVRSRQRTQLCYHVVDFCLFSTPPLGYPQNSSLGYPRNLYTYIDDDIRWFKRSANVWGG